MVKILLVKCFLEGTRPGFKLFLNLKIWYRNLWAQTSLKHSHRPRLRRVTLIRDQKNLRLDLLQGLRIIGLIDSFTYLHHLYIMCTIYHYIVFLSIIRLFLLNSIKNIDILHFFNWSYGNKMYTKKQTVLLLHSSQSTACPLCTSHLMFYDKIDCVSRSLQCLFTVIHCQTCMPRWMKLPP